MRSGTLVSRPGRFAPSQPHHATAVLFVKPGVICQARRPHGGNRRDSLSPSALDSSFSMGTLNVEVHRMQKVETWQQQHKLGADLSQAASEAIAKAKRGHGLPSVTAYNEAGTQVPLTTQLGQEPIKLVVRDTSPEPPPIDASTLQEILGRVAGLEGNVASLKGNVASLKGNVASLKGNVASLKGGRKADRRAFKRLERSQRILAQDKVLLASADVLRTAFSACTGKPVFWTTECTYFRDRLWPEQQQRWQEVLSRAQAGDEIRNNWASNLDDIITRRDNHVTHSNTRQQQSQLVSKALELLELHPTLKVEEPVAYFVLLNYNYIKQEFL